MADRPQQIAIVGASLAGLRAAESLRQEGYEGKVVLVGAEDHLPYDRPPLSKAVLAGKVAPEQTMLRETHVIADLDLDLRLGTAAVDLDLQQRRVLLHGGEAVPYDRVLLATGAAARHLPRAPEMEGVHVLRTVDDAIAIRRAFEAAPRVVVVGAGFIGSEVAATARERGLDVTVLEALPVPLERALGEEMGRVCGQLHRDEGVDLRCNAGVAAFEGSRRVERVRLSDGSAVEADVVIVGVGVRPNTGWLESSGLELNDGIVCDERCRASAPGVFAAGDVARWHNPLFGELMRVEHWTNAADQGAAAAANMVAADGGTPYAPVPYFWSDQYKAKIQSVGHISGGDDVAVVHGSVEDRKFLALYGRNGRLRGALGFSMPRLLMRYRQLLTSAVTWDDALAFAKEQD